MRPSRQGAQHASGLREESRLASDRNGGPITMRTTIQPARLAWLLLDGSDHARHDRSTKHSVSSEPVPTSKHPMPTFGEQQGS